MESLRGLSEEVLRAEVTDFALEKLGEAVGERRFLGGTGYGAFRWCQGPESNWLRPPFQGGALPMSYPGTVAVLKL